MFVQLLVNGLVTGSVYAIAAVGVSLVYGILRLVNFAYGDMMTFGAFAVREVDEPEDPVDERDADGGDRVHRPGDEPVHHNTLGFSLTAPVATTYCYNGMT